MRGAYTQHQAIDELRIYTLIQIGTGKKLDKRDINTIFPVDIDDNFHFLLQKNVCPHTD